MSIDRTVHAVSPDGIEVVRYDRAGKWNLEPSTYPDLPRQHVTLAEAVRFARWCVDNGGRVFLRRPGGGAFDRGYLR